MDYYVNKNMKTKSKIEKIWAAVEKAGGEVHISVDLTARERNNLAKDMVIKDDGVLGYKAFSFKS